MSECQSKKFPYKYTDSYNYYSLLECKTSQKKQKKKQIYWNKAHTSPRHNIALLGYDACCATCSGDSGGGMKGLISVKSELLIFL